MDIEQKIFYSMNWPHLYDDVLKAVPSAYYIAKKWKINQTLVYRTFDDLLNNKIMERIVAVPNSQKIERNIACLFSNSRPNKEFIKELFYNLKGEKIYSGFIEEAYGDFYDLARFRWIILIEYFTDNEEIKKLFTKYGKNFMDIRFYYSFNESFPDYEETLKTSVFYQDLIPIFKRNPQYDSKEISKLRSEIKKIMRKNEYSEFLPLIKFNFIRNKIVKGFLIKDNGENTDFKKLIHSEKFIRDHIIFFRKCGNLKLAIFQYNSMMEEELCNSIMTEAFPDSIKLWNMEMDVKSQV
ncbi:hypothetical protein [Caldiplasma sukawensis]